jgi:hypothetical protein
LVGYSSRLLLVVFLLATGCSSVDDGGGTGSNASDQNAVTATLASIGTSVVPTPAAAMLVELGDACVRNPDEPSIDSFPVAGAVDSVEVSDGCVLAVVASGGVFTLSGDTLAPLDEGLPFDRVVSAFFVGESLWLVGRVGDCVELGFLRDEVWQEVVDPEGGVSCGDQGGIGPIGVSGDKVIFARYPDTTSDEEDHQVELVVYESGTWPDYGVLNGIPVGGVALDAFDTMWIPLWNSKIARSDRESCTYTNAPGAPGGSSGQISGIASGDDGDVWLLARNALSRFDGEMWTSYTSSAEYQRWGAQLEEDAESVVVVTLLGIDGSRLEPQPDFFGGLGQPYDVEIGSTSDIWLGVRFHLAEEGHEDSLIHVSGTRWTVHPLDDANVDIVPEMIAVGGSAVWFAHYNTFGDDSGNSAEPHVYRYVQPAEEPSDVRHPPISGWVA